MMQWKLKMSVLRIHKKQQNFLILDKTCLNEKTLTWGAKGLHAYLMSLPDDWQVRVEDLKERSKNGRDAVRALLKELEQSGFIQKSRCRGSDNGRFEGMEYLVLEVPEPKNDAIPPEPEKPFSGFSDGESGPGNPCPGKPSTENPTLINNKYTNYPTKQVLNKTAADCNNPEKMSFEEEQNAAAVLLSQQQESDKAPKPAASSNQITESFSQEDILIAKTLTANQLSRIKRQLIRLNIGNKEKLIQEIQFCLLSKAHFRGCGTDFAKKLNAILSVIHRGDWQTPAEMLFESQQKIKSNRELLEKELLAATAEMTHFQKLLTTAKDKTRQHFESIIQRAKTKMTRLEQELERELQLLTI